ncbi:GNAT family N-acetyltransferase [Streptomyces sp. NBC_01431]|uniref:GNAT family N-acetyltransferase n=1 Tax=Streptomyces sp. NBC_01431 TaxID=2903863 RepID=UPI002E32C40E|nr:GNAT family N-acetyltransferase [Streptomyces sp. NBC_01431]
MSPIAVREMREADVEAVSAIRLAGWRSAYAGIVPPSYLDAMTVEGDVGRRRTWFANPSRKSTELVAVDAGAPGGWISFGPYRGQLPGAERAGEIYAFYVRPEMIGQGIGRALLAQAHTRMAAQRLQASALWVLGDNQQGRRFYERAGYEADGGTQDDVYDDTTLTELRYRRALHLPGPAGRLGT